MSCKNGSKFSDRDQSGIVHDFVLILSRVEFGDLSLVGSNRVKKIGPRSNSCEYANYGLPME